MTGVVARRFVAALAFMGLIFWLSAQPHLNTGLGVWDTIFRKLAHVTEFGVLTVLWFRALAPLAARPHLLAAAIALAYAISDEYHQSFVPGRHPSPIDVGIDLVGITLAIVVLTRETPLTSVLHRGVEQSGSSPGS